MSVSVDVLSSRLRSLPDSFKGSPGSADAPKLNALIADAMLNVSRRLPTAKQVRPYDCSKTSFGPRKKSLNYFSMLYAVAWLFHDPSLQNNQRDPCMLHQEFFDLLEQKIKPLSELVDAGAVITDADRREELVRICLAAMNVTIEGETQSFSADRLQALNSVERHLLIVEARERRKKEEERQKKIEDERRRKRQAEQAARYNREW